jgi:hypothetical protein
MSSAMLRVSAICLLGLPMLAVAACSPDDPLCSVYPNPECYLDPVVVIGDPPEEPGGGCPYGQVEINGACSELPYEDPGTGPGPGGDTPPGGGDTGPSDPPPPPPRITRELCDAEYFACTGRADAGYAECVGWSPEELCVQDLANALAWCSVALSDCLVNVE